MLVLKNKYFRFLSNAIIFLFFVLILDQLIGVTLRNYYFTSSSGEMYQTTYAMDSIKADVLILGSSRANHHYIPKMIEDQLGMSCYNAGKDGNFLFYSYAVFKSVQKRYRPKIIILDINPLEMQGYQYYDRLSTLQPYYSNKPELRKLIDLKSSFEKIKILSSIYPFNSMFIKLVQGNLTRSLKSEDTLKGYQPLYGSNINGIEPGEKHNVENTALDSNKIKILTKMAVECHKLGIQLLIVKSPLFSKQDQSKADSIIYNIAESNQTVFLNYGNLPMFMKEPSFFKDRGHLNNTGAKIFTNLIIHKLTQTENFQNHPYIQYIKK